MALAEFSFRLFEIPLRREIAPSQGPSLPQTRRLLRPIRARFGSEFPGVVASSLCLVLLGAYAGFAAAGQQAPGPETAALTTERATSFAPVTASDSESDAGVGDQFVEPPPDRDIPADTLVAPPLLTGANAEMDQWEAPPERPAAGPVSAFTSDVVSIQYEPGTAQARPVPETPVELQRVLAIGDSVMLGAANTLLAELPQIRIEAFESAQFPEGVARIRAEVAKPPAERSDVVVLHLGTNGVFDPAQMGELRRLSIALDRLVVLNVRAPRSWESFVNEQLAPTADWSKVRFVDWHKISADRPDWLTGDHVHLSEVGQTAYADLIAEAISP